MQSSLNLLRLSVCPANGVPIKKSFNTRKQKHFQIRLMNNHQNNYFIIAFFYEKLVAIEKEEHYQKQEKMTMHAFEPRVIMKWLSEKGFHCVV